MIFRHLLNMRSHPTWVRGLKHTTPPHCQCTHLSHPTWVRGLKRFLVQTLILDNLVAPYVGAWIETGSGIILCVWSIVAPYVGAWIETIPRSSVSCALPVAPYVGAWIETKLGIRHDNSRSRTLRGCVD